MKNFIQFISSATLCILISFSAYSQISNNTRLLSQPAVSKTNIAFIYAEDLWIANIDGSNPIRLTIDDGVESNPIFSPDGSTIAFSASYEGNVDVYTVSKDGGVPKRLTWHPNTDLVRDFTPDGKSILFASQRNSHTRRYAQLFKVQINGGTVEQLKIPNANWANYSNDGSHIAYTPIGDKFNQWKHYRGGTMSRIWLYNSSNYKVTEIPKPSGGSNDSKPQWVANDVYFKSDRNGEFNLFSYNVTSKSVEQLTDFKDFPVIDISSNNEHIIFEQAGYLHLYTILSKTTKQLKINISTDLLELRERYISDKKYVRTISISPSGARVVVDYRGEIITVPAKKGDPMNLTNTPGVHEKYPEWSPDGKSIAYFSDTSGEYTLHIQNTSTNNIEKIKLNGTGFYANIHWAPDSKKLAFVDNGRNLYITDLNSKKITKIAEDELYIPGPFRDLFSDWSFDSKWIAYTTVTETHFEKAFLYSLQEKKSYAISDGLSSVSEPIFDPSGKYLYMLASTDAGPVVNWFDQSNQDMKMTSNIYLVTLQKDVLSPFSKENDQEEPKKDEKDEKESKPTHLTINWNSIENRIIDIPVKASDYRSLGIAKEGELFYISTKDNKSTISKFDFKTRKEEVIMPGQGFVIANGGEKMLYVNKGSFGISDLGKKPENGTISFSSIKVKINPVKEWSNIFNETWRVNRDYFYDPGMHGVDWKATKAKYSVFLPYLSCKNDLYRVMEWMCSEIGVGHHRFGSRGDKMNDPSKISGGLLGADYKIKNNRYQIEKIYGGLNWNPEMRSPLTEPGVNVEVGDYIISVNGNSISATDNFYSFFENTADNIVTLKVSGNSDGSNSRTVKVTPISNESALRNRDWVEGNLKKVHEATNGEVAYVYVPNTADAGHQYFKRYFFPQATKKAIIIDERYNGGGQLADYYIDLLIKPEQARWNFRYGKDLKSPSASIQGPKVLIADENAGSGGDYFPFLFRKFEVGTIVGKTTWGGLVGVLGYPEFIDGGSVTAPNVAFYTENGFRVENEGVTPDIEVEQWPELIINGHDPQLEKAIEIAKKQLLEYPRIKTETPPYPIKTKN